MVFYCIIRPLPLCCWSKYLSIDVYTLILGTGQTSAIEEAWLHWPEAWLHWPGDLLTTNTGGKPIWLRRDKSNSEVYRHNTILHQKSAVQASLYIRFFRFCNSPLHPNKKLTKQMIANDSNLCTYILLQNCNLPPLIALCCILLNALNKASKYSSHKNYEKRLFLKYFA